LKDFVLLENVCKYYQIYLKAICNYFMNANEPLSFTFPVAPQIPNDFPYELINHKKEYTWRNGKIIIPIYHYSERTIWGLTARIMHNFIRLFE